MNIISYNNFCLWQKQPVQEKIKILIQRNTKNSGSQLGIK
jgi:hypothetical protein